MIIEGFRMKKIGILLFCLVLAASFIVHASADTSMLRGYDPDSKTFQYIYLGEYPYEADGTVKPLLWRILSTENNQLFILTEYIIDRQQVIFETDKNIIAKHAFRRIESYAESDLYTWMNSELLNSILGDNAIQNAIINVPEQGLLYPLTIEEYLTDSLGFYIGQWAADSIKYAYPRRQGVATPYAVASGLYRDHSNGKSPFWCIAIKNVTDYKFGLVGYNGHISWGAYTNIKVGGVRPGMRLNMDQVTVTGGSGSMEDPYTLAYNGQAPAEDKTAPEASDPEPADTHASITEETEKTEEPAPAAEQEPADTGKQEEEPAAGAKENAVISLLGDCSVGDALGTIKAQNSYHTVIREKGYSWPFSLVSSILSSDDLTVANLEVVLTEGTKHKDIKYPLRGQPDHVNVLLEGSIEAVNTVNNHSLDYTRSGYTDTLATLDTAGIGHFGSMNYMNDDGFDDILVQDVNGIRFGFFGFSYPHEGDIKHMDAIIEDLRTNRRCDVIIASMHWGREGYTDASKLTSLQLNLSAHLIDQGVDVVYGHHPHVLQPMVFYKDKPILFSTGNFTFGTISSDIDNHTAIFQLSFRKTDEKTVLQKLEVIPCMVGKKGDYRPYVTEDEKEREKTFRILSPNRNISRFTRAPESFRSTGTVLFDENGIMAGD